MKKKSTFKNTTALIALFALLAWGKTSWGQVNITPTRTDVSGFATWTDVNVAGTTYLQLLTATSSTISPAMNFDNYTLETLDFKARTYGGVNVTENTITVWISTNNGGSWTSLGTRCPLNTTLTSMTQFDLSSYSGTQVKIKFTVAGSSNTIGAGIDDIDIKGTVASCTPPTTQASGLSTSSPTTDGFSTGWTAGSGNGTMIVVRPTAQSNTLPTSGTSYTANLAWGSAGQIDANNRVLFRAAGTSAGPITGLVTEIQYTVTAYEYASATNCYNTTSPPTQTLYTLSLEPSAHAASFSASAVSGSQIDLSFSAANTLSDADGYIILQRTGAAPTGTPTDATAYTVGNTIGDGTVAAIITNSASTSASITGLSASTQYYFTLIPYNWNTSAAQTYNYRTAATIPSANATTLAPAPEINIKQNVTNYLTGSTYNFGNVEWGSVSDVTFTIENTGSANLTLGSATIGGSGFTLQANYTSPVAASGSTTFTIRFTPNATGAFSGSISIPTNDSDENPYVVIFSGNGTANNNADIVNTFSNGEPDNIAYTSYQEADLTGTSLEVGRFSIRDGGASGTDADNLGTTLTAITVSLSNFSNVRRVALYDGTTELGTEQAGAASITFNGLSIIAADNSSKQYSIRASFNASVTDNQQIQFTVTSATAGAAGSTFAAANAGGAVTSVTGNDNRIEVVASDIIFDQDATNASVAVAMSPSPSLWAVDDNVNIDLDYNTAYTVSISTGSTTFHGSATTTGNFVAGVATLSNLVFATAATDNKITVTSNLFTDISVLFDVTEFIYAAGDVRPLFAGTDLSHGGTSPYHWEEFNGTSWTNRSSSPQSVKPTRVIIHQASISGGGNSSNTYNDIIIIDGGELILNDWAATPIVVFIASGKKLEVQSGGKLYVQGNFDMNGSGQANLIVRSGGTMIINEPNMDNNQEMWEGIENFEAGSYVEYQDWNWTTSSTAACLVNITTTITNNSQGYKFGNFTLNTTKLSSTHWTFVGGSIGIINLAYNDLTVNTNGTGYVGGASNKTGTNGFIVNGNLIINQGNFCFGSSYSGDPFSHQFTVNGNFEFNSTGTLKIHRNNSVASAVSGYVNLKGNIKIVSGATISNDNAADATKMKLNFAGSGTTQTVDIVPVVTNVPVYVKSPAVVALIGTHLQMDANSPLTIESGGKLNINPGKWATISGTLTNSAGAGGLIIKSDASGTGSLINSTSSVAATYERYLAGGSNVWHQIFSPLSGATLPVGYVYSYAEGAEDIWNTTTNFGWNTALTPDAFQANVNTGWNAASGSFSTMQGYIFNTESTSTSSFTGGSLEVGNKSFNTNYTTHSNTIPTSGSDASVPPVSYVGCKAVWNEYDGWVFVGNPYSSAIDWTSAYDGDPDIEGGAYMWDSGSKNYKYFLDGGTNTSFTVGIASDGGATAAYISSGQGFFVKSRVASASFTIPNTARVHNNHAFWKGKNEVYPNMLRMNIAKDDFVDETVVCTIEGSTDGHDGSFDLHKKFSLDTSKPQIFTFNSETENQFALNSFPSIGTGKQVPVGLWIGETGEYTINFTENSYAGVRISLEDKLLVDTIALETNPSYTFDVSETGLNYNRFVLHFNANNAPLASGTIENQQTDEDQTYQFTSTVDFTDPDLGDNVTVTAECPTWLAFDSETKTFSGVPTNSEVGNYTIKLIGTDLMNAKTEVSFNLEVVNTNDAPELLVPLSDQTAKVGVEFNFALPVNTFGDIDAGDILNFSAQLENGSALPEWLSFNTSAKVFSGTPSEPETLNIEVLASDLSSSTASDVFEILVSPASSVEQNMEMLLSIYPNPCKDFVTIQKKGVSGSAQIVMRNMMGVPVYFGQFEGTNTQIDMSRYASGVYFIEITTEQHTQNYKFMIE